jgi:hypothetical protein
MPRVIVIAVAAAFATASVLLAQERPVPKDSARISIPGCAKGTRFIVGRAPAHEPVRAEIAPGRRFRLNGKKPMMEEIKKQEGRMIEVTGLVRQSDLGGPGGIAIGGVRIGGGPPQAGTGGVGDARRNTGSLDAVIDVESWRALAEGCSTR